MYFIAVAAPMLPSDERSGLRQLMTGATVLILGIGRAHRAVGVEQEMTFIDLQWKASALGPKTWENFIHSVYFTHNTATPRASQYIKTARHTLKLTMARLSGLQKDVLGLYRQCLRQSRLKPEVLYGAPFSDNLAQPESAVDTSLLQTTRKHFEAFARWAVPLLTCQHRLSS